MVKKDFGGPSEFPMGTRVAFDVHYSSKQIGDYARHGHIVVCVARNGEPDDEWLDRAYERGAEVVFSQDTDAGIIIDKNGWNVGEKPMTWRRWA